MSFVVYSWSRYPGLQCDVESYIYLPFLEEMGYCPKRRYSSGVEIRSYLESVATKYELHDRAMFQTGGESMQWDDQTHEWVVKLKSSPKGGQSSNITISADFVVMTPGREPRSPELEDFTDCSQASCTKRKYLM